VGLRRCDRSSTTLAVAVLAGLRRVLALVGRALTLSRSRYQRQRQESDEDQNHTNAFHDLS